MFFPIGVHSCGFDPCSSAGHSWDVVMTLTPEPPSSPAGFPTVRPRRLRRHPLLRGLVRETTLSPADFILPLFVRPGPGVRQEIGSMPGQYQLSPDRLADEVGAAAELGVRSFILFGIPPHKDATGSSAVDDGGIVQEALRV